MIKVKCPVCEGVITNPPNHCRNYFDTGPHDVFKCKCGFELAVAKNDEKENVQR